MNQPDLTTEGMRQGVYDSDVVIIFLTNSYLSRPFCVAEVTYALKFKKPIIIVTEEEERFWPFDVKRWQHDRCIRVSGGGPYGDGWVDGHSGKTSYKDCPQTVKDLIEERANDGSMLPFRRRDFEVNALTREIVSNALTREIDRASKLGLSCGVTWGSRLPPAPALMSLDDNAQRCICIFAKESDYTTKVIDECKASIEKFAPKTDWTDDIGSSANHVLMILSKGCVDEGTRSKELLEKAAARSSSSSRSSPSIAFIYITKESSKEEGWDFDEFYPLHSSDPSLATETVAAAEALKFREKGSGDFSTEYEHNALVLELLGRMPVTLTSSEEEDEEGGAVGALRVDTATRQVHLTTAKCVSLRVHRVVLCTFSPRSHLSLSLSRSLSLSLSLPLSLPRSASRRSFYFDPATGNTAWGDTLRTEGRLPAAAAPTAPAPAAAAVKTPLPSNWVPSHDAAFEIPASEDEDEDEDEEKAVDEEEESEESEEA